MTVNVNMKTEFTTQDTVEDTNTTMMKTVDTAGKEQNHHAKINNL